MSSRKLELVWHALAFMLLLGAFIPLWRQNTLRSIDLVSGDPVQRVFLGIAYFGVSLLMLHLKQVPTIVKRGGLLWALVGWALISYFWSAAPQLTLRRGFSLLLSTLYSLLLVSRYSYYEVLRTLGAALAVIVITSLCVAWIFPQWGVMGSPHPGAWQGVLYHKNALGRTCVLALLVFWMLYRGQRGGVRCFWGALMLMALVALIGSRSATSWITALILAIIGLWLQSVVKLPRLLQPAAATLAMTLIFLTLVLLLGQLEKVLGFFGKDLTLTGRIPLWETLIPIALEKPLVGYGYGAFWQGAMGPSAPVWVSFSWAQHAHNGYIDLWLETGLIGLLLGLFLLAHLFIRTGKRALQRGSADFWGFAFLFSVFFALISSTEAVLLESGLSKALYWIMLSYIYFFPGPLDSDSGETNSCDTTTKPYATYNSGLL